MYANDRIHAWNMRQVRERRKQISARRCDDGPPKHIAWHNHDRIFLVIIRRGEKYGSVSAGERVAEWQKRTTIDTFDRTVLSATDAEAGCAAACQSDYYWRCKRF